MLRFADYIPNFVHLEAKVVLRLDRTFHYIDLGAVVSMVSSPFRTFMVSVMCLKLCTGPSTRPQYADEWVVFSKFQL